MTWADGIEEGDRRGMASSSARLARKGREVCKYSFTWHPLRGTTLMGAEAGACRENRSVVTSNYIRMNVCTYLCMYVHTYSGPLYSGNHWDPAV